MHPPVVLPLLLVFACIGASHEHKENGFSQEQCIAPEIPSSGLVLLKSGECSDHTFNQVCQSLQDESFIPVQCKWSKESSSQIPSLRLCDGDGSDAICMIESDCSSPAAFFQARFEMSGNIARTVGNVSKAGIKNEFAFDKHVGLAFDRAHGVTKFVKCRPSNMPLGQETHLLGGKSVAHVCTGSVVLQDHNATCIAYPAADEDLPSFLLAWPLPSLKQKTEIFRSMMLGVKSLHDAGIVHRDLKLGHILRFGQEWRVADLDMSSAIGAEITEFSAIGWQHWCKRGLRMGEWATMVPVPEHAAMVVGMLNSGTPTVHTPVHVERSMDVFQLGILFAEMICNHTFFLGQDGEQVLRTVASDRELDLKCKGATTTTEEAALAICLSMAQKRPENRPNLDQALTKIDQLQSLLSRLALASSYKRRKQNKHKAAFLESSNDSKNGGFKVSFVVAVHTGDRGTEGGLVTRLQKTIDILAYLCDKHKLPSELLLVQYHPCSTISPLDITESLSWPQHTTHLQPATAMFTLPPGHDRNLPAWRRNAGIRLARGGCVATMDVGAVPNEHAIMWLAQNTLESDAIYTMDRWDVGFHLPTQVRPAAALDFAETHVFMKRQGWCWLWHRTPRPEMAGIPVPWRDYHNEFETMLKANRHQGDAISTFVTSVGEVPFQSSSAFVLMTADTWHKLGGFPHHLNSTFDYALLLIHAAQNDIQQVLLRPPMAVLMQVHDNQHDNTANLQRGFADFQQVATAVMRGSAGVNLHPPDSCGQAATTTSAGRFSKQLGEDVVEDTFVVPQCGSSSPIVSGGKWKRSVIARMVGNKIAATGGARADVANCFRRALREVSPEDISSPLHALEYIATLLSLHTAEAERDGAGNYKMTRPLQDSLKMCKNIPPPLAGEDENVRYRSALANLRTICKAIILSVDDGAATMMMDAGGVDDLISLGVVVDPLAIAQF